MSCVNHGYFGALDNIRRDRPSVLWEQKLSINGLSVKAQLWGGTEKTLVPHRLDAFASLLKDLPRIDALARDQLRRHLRDAPHYIEYHLESIPSATVMTALIKESTDSGGPINVAAFAAAMQLRRISLWHGSPDSPIVLDYMIAPTLSDETLAVKLRLNGDVADVSWES